MKPIEKYADKQCCELCGARITAGGIDPVHERTGAEVMRRLAFIADKSPAVALLLVHHIAGRTERKIAALTKMSPATVHRKIIRVKQLVSQFSQ